MANELDYGTGIALIKALGKPTDAQVTSAVDAWLDAHPEATTTVQDGSITNAKLDASLQETVADVGDLKTQIDDMATATSLDVGKALSPKTVSGGKVTEWQYKVIGGGGGGAVEDVQINGVSIVDGEGVANVPLMGENTIGVAKLGSSNGTYGLIISGGMLMVNPADDYALKTGSGKRKPITSEIQNKSVFYALAQAAGDSTQSSSSNAVGTYTESAKSAISEMLSGSVAITGTTPSITALPGIRYVCGECATLAITLPASGIVDVVFTSGSTPTVLTVTPPTGTTVHWPEWFDPDTLEASVTYEISIADGFGAVSVWA